MSEQNFIPELLRTLTGSPSFSKLQEIPFLFLPFLSLESLLPTVQSAPGNLRLEEEKHATFVTFASLLIFAKQYLGFAFESQTIH